MTEAVALGLLFGVGAALSVGPISVMILHAAVTRGFGAALHVIAGSAVGDILLVLPAIAATWLIERVAGLGGTIAVLGAVYFGILSFRAIREARALWRGGSPSSVAGGWSFASGVVGNLLNPLSWSFWVATGTPTMLRVYQSASWAGVLVFTCVWFAVAMAVEACIAFGVAQTRRAITGRTLATFDYAAAGVFLMLAANLLLNR